MGGRGKNAVFDENPEWTEADFARARPASEVHGKEFAASMIRKRAVPSPSNGFDSNTWAVVIAGGDYGIREVPAGELISPDVIAFHPSKRSAEDALDRVTAFHMNILENLRQIVEREAKVKANILSVPAGDAHPDIAQRYLDQSREFEAEIRNRNLVALFEIARPREKPSA